MELRHTIGYTWYLLKIILEIIFCLLCLKANEANRKIKELKRNSYRNYLKVMIICDKYKQRRAKKSFL